METKKGHVLKKDNLWVFRSVYLIEDGDAVQMEEIPLSPEYIHTIKDNEKVEVYIVESADETKIARILPKDPQDMPYTTDFPELWVRSINDLSVHEVFKYIKDQEGRIHIWSSTWYGHHIIGMDCVFEHVAYKE